MDECSSCVWNGRCSMPTHVPIPCDGKTDITNPVVDMDEAKTRLVKAVVRARGLVQSKNRLVVSEKKSVQKIHINKGGENADERRRT